MPPGETTKVTSDHVRGLRELVRTIRASERVVVCLEPRRRRTDDGIDVMPAEVFARQLAAGELF